MTNAIRRPAIGALLLSAMALPAPATAQQDAPTPQTQARQRAAAASLPGDAAEDVSFATRGYLGTRADPVIRTADGRPVFRLGSLAFATGDAPGTVNPSLWRHAGLLGRHGLFQVTGRIWQVRGFDLANITFVRGTKGWVVVDALGSAETARAAYDLVSEKLGRRPISAVVITHSHSDHFGGVDGLVTPGDASAPVIVPAGFAEAAVSENVVAGPAMNRRAGYQFGVRLPQGPQGSMGSGIGPGLSLGTRALPRGDRVIDRDGTEMTVDGVRMRFQLTPGTEAPAEMNVAFPDWKVIDMAENANVTQHNILTPRGAVVRDTRAWVDGLTRAIEANGNAEVMIASHGWPRFGARAVRDYLTRHRDAYAYLHDQTVRLMNQGLTGDAIAARLALPPALSERWYNRPYYGSISFNARAVYQFYLGWYDGNPAHLAAYAPEEEGRRYVRAMGGPARVLDAANDAFATGDYGWAATLLNHLVLSGEGGPDARALLARSYRQLAWQSENSLWRNMYLTGAAELTDQPPPPAAPVDRAGLAASLSLDDLAIVLATRVDPAKAGEQQLSVRLAAADGTGVTLRLEHGVLVRGRDPQADVTLAGARPALVAAMLGDRTRFADGSVTVTGRREVLARLAGVMDAPDPSFPIVLPRAAAGSSGDTPPPPAAGTALPPATSGGTPR